ncbi:unnamed protein product, partial [Discosporangium mesarthrocarpum]
MECFGKLKGWLMILNIPIPYQASCGNPRGNIDMFPACCILHNMLHAYDGLPALGLD